MPLINNKEARLITLPGRLRLKPGMNDIDAAAWGKAKKHSGVQAMLKAKAIEEGGASGDTDADDPTSMLLSDAKATIAETFDVKLLDKWEAAEKAGQDRKGFHDLIDAQRQVIADTEMKDEEK